MAVLDSTSMRPPYPAREFLLRGVALEVAHKVEGRAAVLLTAIVEITKMTFLDPGGTRKESSATVVFPRNIGVGLADTVKLPGEETPRAVLKVTSRYGLTVQYDGRLTEVLLA